MVGTEGGDGGRSSKAVGEDDESSLVFEQHDLGRTTVVTSTVVVEIGGKGIRPTLISAASRHVTSGA